MIAGAATVALTVAESTRSGTDLGAAFAATDADNDTVTWKLSGDGAGSFSISSGGQMSTAAGLDFESKMSYSLVVTADDGNGGSDSVTVTVTVTDTDEPPSAPGAPAVWSVSSSSLSVWWSAPTNTGPAIAGGWSAWRFTLFENARPPRDLGSAFTATDADGDTVTWKVLGDDAASFSISSGGQLRLLVAPDYETKKSYSSTVVAEDGNGGSDSVTVEVTVLDLPEAPHWLYSGSLTVTPLSQTSLSVRWLEPSYQTGPALTGYYVQFRTAATDSTAAGNWQRWEHNGTGLTTTITGLTLGTAYNVRVHAFNDEDRSRWITSGAVSTLGASVPGAITDLVAVPGDERVELSWSVPDDGASAITKFQYRQRTGSGRFGDWTNMAGSDATTGSYTVTGLVNGTEYSFRVRAANGVGAGPGSNEVTATAANRPPVIGGPASLWFRVAENTGSGSEVGNPLTAVDPDGDSLTWELSGAAASSFSIDSGGRTGKTSPT